RVSPHAFLAVSALLFAASAAMTIVWCTSMSSMGRMPMPGNWTMSMMWMRMPGQAPLRVAIAFLGMWIAMMAAMMLPTLVPMLWRYRECVADAAATRTGPLSVLVSAGYFFVWSVWGAAIFPLGSAAAAIAMRYQPVARAVPIAVGAAVLVAGLLQLTAWK